MKKMLFGSLALAFLASIVAAGEGRVLRSSSISVTPVLAAQVSEIPLPAPLSPTPDPAYSGYSQPLNQYPSSPYPGMGDSFGAQGYPVASQPIELFRDVRYHGSRNIAPCAVPTIIQVSDPCNRDRCCKTCVSVQVCVPPCDPQKIKVTRDGDRVRYDYGKYAVVVKTVGHHVVVHYQD